MGAAVNLIVFLALQGAAAPEKCVTEAAPLIRDFRACSAIKAAALEPSGESATDIATAAVGACKEFKTAVIEKVSSCLPPYGLVHVSDKMDEAGKALATETVVNMRAKNHPNPSIKPQ